MTETTSLYPPAPDLNAYFARIGYSGARTPMLETLTAIVQHHERTIPFENVSPYLRLPVVLDLASLEAKLVQSRRGGFCFEQNGLLRQILLALGYESRPLGARVVYGSPPDAMPARTHMIQLVTIAGIPYTVDVGFGGMTPPVPLRLEPGLVQETTHEPYRYVRQGEDYLLEVRIGDEWRSLYRFDLSWQQQSDYEVGNYWVCHHPDSHFLSGLSAARIEPGQRYALRDNRLNIHHTGGESEERLLTSVRELEEVLEQTFYITLPEVENRDTALGQLVA